MPALSDTIRDPRATATRDHRWRRPRFTRAQRREEREIVAALGAALRVIADDRALKREVLRQALAFARRAARSRGVPFESLYVVEVCRRYLDLLAVEARQERRRLNRGQGGRLDLHAAATGLATHLAAGAGAPRTVAPIRFIDLPTR